MDKQQVEANLSIKEVCKLSKLSHQTIYDQINAGRLQTIRVGRRRLVTPNFYRAWQERLERESTMEDVA